MYVIIKNYSTMKNTIHITLIVLGLFLILFNFNLSLKGSTLFFAFFLIKIIGLLLLFFSAEKFFKNNNL